MAVMSKAILAGCCAVGALLATAAGNSTRLLEEPVSVSGEPLEVSKPIFTYTTTTTTSVEASRISYQDYFPLEATTTTTTTTTTTVAPSTQTLKGRTWSFDVDTDLDTPTGVERTHEDVPYLIDNMYGFYERGEHIVELQMLLGMDYVDGTYGPATRKKHMLWFGGFEKAQAHFYERSTWYLETVDPEEPWKHNWDAWDSPPTLQQLVDIYFEPADRTWALRVAFCESSAQPKDTYSNAVSSALAVGWFQHLSRFWLTRSELSGWEGFDIFDTEANVAVAAWLFYETRSSANHWNPSRPCWGDTPYGQ